MTVVAGIFFVLITAWLAWRGYRRGAAAVLRGWLPRLSALACLYLTAWLVWSATGSLAATCLAGIAAVVLVFGGVSLALRRSRRRAGDERQLGDVSPTPDAQPSILNRIAGACLGVLHAEVCILGLACLGSTIVFGVSASRMQESATKSAAPTPEWVEGLGEACRTVAGISDFGLLRHLPLLKEYGREIRPLIAILNASPEKLARIAEKRNLMRFVDTDAVKAALLDAEYCTLIERARGGDLSAVRSLLESPLTRGLVACPEIREFAKTMTPSQLLMDMEEGVAPSTPANTNTCDDGRMSLGD